MRTRDPYRGKIFSTITLRSYLRLALLPRLFPLTPVPHNRLPCITPTRVSPRALSIPPRLPLPMSLSDKVHITGLQASATVGLDHWQKPVPQPVQVDVVFATDFARALDADNLAFSLNYAVVSAKLAHFFAQSAQRNFRSLGGLGDALMRALDQERLACSAVEVRVAAPKLAIHALVSFSEKTAEPGAAPGDASVYTLSGLRALTLIGVFTFEREAKQYVVVDLQLGVPARALDVCAVSARVHQYLERSNFKTVEALIKKTAQLVLASTPEVAWAAVRVTKPNAIVYTDGVGVSGRYSREDFAEDEAEPNGDPTVPLGVSSAGTGSKAVSGSAPADAAASIPFDLPVASPESFSGTHTVYIAFGSNIDALANITRGLRLLEDHPSISLDATLALYVSKPMYVTDQQDFVNGVVRVRVRDMTPHQLLAHLKHIEYAQCARVKHGDNGPRTLDLDIVLFGAACVNTPDLTVPHRAMLLRTFVLLPLCELLPPDFIHPVTAEPVHDHWAKLAASPADAAVQESHLLVHMVPGSGARALLSGPTRPSSVMAIFNATPDSFSDGGVHCDLLPQDILAAARRMVQQGATVIDVGGCSTRPGSEPPLAQEEARRVVRVVQTLRAAPDFEPVLISVDTYRASVAEAALAAGADIINDVLMGTADPAMFDVVARAGCGYVLSHLRGTPATMASLTDYSAPCDDHLVQFWHDVDGPVAPLPAPDRAVVEGVCRELARQVHLAEARGVRKWQLILDPGVGFAKTTAQNVAVVRHARRLKQYAQWDSATARYTAFAGMPVLVGTSRKRFLREIADGGDVALAAAVVASIQQGADVVRVHDVAGAASAVRTADAIFRGVPSLE